MDKKLLVGGGVVAAILLYFGLRKSSASIQPGPVSAIQGGNLHLTKGRYYGGRLAALGLPPFTANADEETIGKGLVALGFQDVRVFMNEGELPPQLRYEHYKAGASASSRWFTGAWSGMTTDVPKPPSVDLLYVIAPPSLEAKWKEQGLLR